MRQALECCHRGWGESIVIGVAEAGKEIATRPSSSSPAGSEGLGLWRARGAHGRPKIVDWYMEGKINIDDLITHKLPLERINEGFDLMHEGKSIRAVVEF
jgi:S-(hydroxymethyl)glutathione dehydrogenase/alcohol dehydrogenase